MEKNFTDVDVSTINELRELALKDDWFRVFLGIRNAMNENHISDKQLADFLGYRESTVKRILKGKYNLRLKTLMKICYYVGLEVCVLTVDSKFEGY